MSDKSMKLEQATFILRHGSAEGEHKYFEAISVIEKAYNRLKAENKNCGKTIQNQREQLKACNEKIKEQQAEIERLKKENHRFADIGKMYSEIRAEACKEFVEAYKDQIKNYTGMFTDEGFYVSLEAVLSAVDFIFEKLKEDGGT